MKQAALAIFAAYFGALEFKGDLLNYWLPACGFAVNHGYAWIQFATLILLAVFVFGSGVIIAYQL